MDVARCCTVDLATELAVRDADYDRDDAEARAQAALRRHQGGGIPRIIHKVWFDMGKGARPPRDAYGAMDDALEALHPPDDGWTVVRWGLGSAERLVAGRYPGFAATWASYKSPIYRVDAIRYLILHAFGGIYVDQDVLPLRSLTPMIERSVGAPHGEARRVVLVRSPYWLREVSNFVMAAEPGSAFMAAVITDLPRRAASLWHARDSFVGTMSVAGPRVLIAAVRRTRPQDGVCVLGPASFASVAPRAAEDPADAAYGIHGFKSAWGVGRKIAADALRASVLLILVLTVVTVAAVWRRSAS